MSHPELSPGEEMSVAELVDSIIGSHQCTEPEAIKAITDQMGIENRLNPPDKIYADETTYDNRDESETWLRVPNVGIVVVNPVALFQNMIRNCYDPNNKEVDRSDLHAMADWLKEFL